MGIPSGAHHRMRCTVAKVAGRATALEDRREVWTAVAKHESSAVAAVRGLRITLKNFVQLR
jgi:hypothetical protein